MTWIHVVTIIAASLLVVARIGSSYSRRAQFVELTKQLDESNAILLQIEANLHANDGLSADSVDSVLEASADDEVVGKGSSKLVVEWANVFVDNMSSVADNYFIDCRIVIDAKKGISGASADSMLEQFLRLYGAVGGSQPYSVVGYKSVARSSPPGVDDWRYVVDSTRAH